MKVELNAIEINDVLGAVWLATAILTYEKHLNMKGKLKYTDIAFSQTEIRKLASKISAKKINSVRISQWGNADHPNNQRNYLKEVGTLRRLTIQGEHHGDREMPENLLDSKQILFVNPYTNKSFCYLDLIHWLKTDLKNLTK